MARRDTAQHKALCITSRMCLIRGARMHACTHASTPSIHPPGVFRGGEKKNVPTYGKAGVVWSGVEWSQGDCGVRRALEYAPHPRRSAQLSSAQLSRHFHRAGCMQEMMAPRTGGYCICTCGASFIFFLSLPCIPREMMLFVIPLVYFNINCVDYYSLLWGSDGDHVQ